MIHHDDSMLLKPTQLNSHNKQALQLMASMRLRAAWSGSDSLRICRNRRLPHHQLGEQVATRNKSTAFHRVRSMEQGRQCSRVRCSTVKIFKLRIRRGSKHSITSNTACTEWPSLSRRSLRTSRSHSTDHERGPRPRHSPRNLGCHRRRNTTLQDSLVSLACLLPNSRHSKSLQIINNPAPIHSPALHLFKLIPTL